MAKRPNPPLSFADLLRQWRDRHSLTQAAAAEVMRVPMRTLCGWEQGRSPGVALAMAHYLSLLEKEMRK